MKIFKLIEIYKFIVLGIKRFFTPKKNKNMDKSFNSRLWDSEKASVFELPTISNNIESIKNMNRRIKYGRAVDLANINKDFSRSWNDVSKIFSRLSANQ